MSGRLSWVRELGAERTSEKVLRERMVGSIDSSKDTSRAGAEEGVEGEGFGKATGGRSYQLLKAKKSGFHCEWGRVWDGEPLGSLEQMSNTI